MQKTEASPAKPRPLLLLALAIIAALLYGAACLVIFRGERPLSMTKKTPLDASLLSAQGDAFTLLRPDFYRELADHLQYYPHDPNILPALYRKAISHGPADYRNFFSYAHYLSSRNCCKSVVKQTVLQTIYRCPTNPNMYRVAAMYFLSSESKQVALPYFRRAIELEPTAATQLYQLLDQAGIDREQIIRVTPVEPDSMIRLCHYLQATNAQNELVQCVKQLSKLKMDSNQQLETAVLASSAGLVDIATQLGKSASSSDDLKIRALQLLADQEWKKQNLDGYQKYSAEVEKIFLEQGKPVEAAQWAIRCALLFTSRSKAEEIEKLLEVTRRYPQYAPTYAQLASLSSDQSKELQLYYLKKAEQLDPTNDRFRQQLANYYLRQSNFEEAEKLFEQLLANPDTEESAYLGLSRCKVGEGKLPEAIAVLEQALNKGASSPQIMTELVRRYTESRSGEKALPLIKQLLDQAPNKPESHNLAADLYMSMARYSDAHREYEMVLGLQPGNAHASQGIKKLKTLGY